MNFEWYDKSALIFHQLILHHVKKESLNEKLKVVKEEEITFITQQIAFIYTDIFT